MNSAEVRISTERIRRNVERLQQLARPANLIAVIKADGYGHGAVATAQLLRQCGVTKVAVARLSEAIELRQNSHDGEILVLGAPLPDDWSVYDEHNLSATIPTLEHARELAESHTISRAVRVHVKVDTGMRRLGMSPDDLAEAMRILSGTSNATVAGIWTHLSEAGADTPEGTAFTREQIDQFHRAVTALDELPPAIHVANSTAIIKQLRVALPELSIFARAGLAIYGIGETAELARNANLEPAMQFVARITQMREIPAGSPVSYSRTWRAPEDTVIATVGAGYADGYPRLLSNHGEVSIQGRLYPVVGNICMDMFMVNLGSVDSVPNTVRRSTPVVLFGPDGPSAYRVAEWARTIPYEICSRIGARVPRIHVKEFDNPVTQI